ncbi:tryptophan halogenase family protein [Synechococcus sp. MIT S9220]|uniref:tryptophan 7-halogenase n=1 Tax=unclassified Synechococcus TaxID=2626047 RepID=UPI00164C47DC|nr:tryptophan 7-halogenase [Synechococcus sp. MIT S9220]NOL47635.1 tryptophan 7-halogenase [Synechococcus sp. MIT S9220]QNJ21972.1 tryptophan halogenase family protein [Synechococcus sp. MIT S9220]
MRFAILGLGTAGAIGARMLRRQFPGASITIFHAPEIPTIGVGEGAGPWFRRWLDEEGITPTLMEAEANATKKQGICFENWGGHAKQHHHIFTPARTAFSYHFDANKITTLLLRGIKVQVIPKTASEALAQNQQSVWVKLNGQEKVNYDYVIDCRGFKASEGVPASTETQPLIANAAILQKCEETTITESNEHDELKSTKAVARPYGWIFQIPLNNKNSVGYVHDSSLCTPETVNQDLNHYMEEHRLVASSKRRTIQFKNHLGEQHLQGRVYRLGNRAGFIEPLEATSIEMTVHHCKLIAAHIKQRELTSANEANLRSSEKRFNAIVRSNMEKVALFVSWHYSNGSIYNTAYWRKAKDNHGRLLKEQISRETVKDFSNWCTKEHQEETSNKPSQGKDQMFFAWNTHSFNAIRNSIA